MPTGSIVLPANVALGAGNVLLSGRGRRHFVRDFPGPLSIKAVLEGRVSWKTEGRETWADRSAFLVLNDGEPYSMELDAVDPVTTCCVFFERGFVETIARDLTHPGSCALDAPEPGRPAIGFLSRLHPADNAIAPSMLHLRRRAIEGAGRLELDGMFLVLAGHLLSLYQEVQVQIARVPAAKLSTRQEMILRISRGREFLHAHALDPISLADAAKAACLSRYHFHRMFRQVFRETPHAYVTRVRLDHAMHLLARGLPVTQTCAAVGFNSVGSFSALFRSRFGRAPSNFRA